MIIAKLKKQGLSKNIGHSSKCKSFDEFTHEVVHLNRSDPDPLEQLLIYFSVLNDYKNL